MWFLAEDDDVATKHHAVIIKVFNKSFQAKCDDGSIWKGVLIELMRGPDHPNGVWQRAQDLDTESDCDEPVESVEPAEESVEPAVESVELVKKKKKKKKKARVEEPEDVEIVVVGQDKKRRFR
eukprot:COSAG06_NODE_2714_length_6403_cov_23.366593_2_plen_123_part_00